MPELKSRGKAIRIRKATPKEAGAVGRLRQARADYLNQLESELRKINRWSWRLLRDLQQARRKIS